MKQLLFSNVRFPSWFMCCHIDETECIIWELGNVFHWGGFIYPIHMFVLKLFINMSKLFNNGVFFSCGGFTRG